MQNETIGVSAKDLRIGNYVIAKKLHEGKVFEVEGIGILQANEDERVIFFKDKMVGEYIKDISPIPLDAEWLERAGWVKCYPQHEGVYLAKDLQIGFAKFNLDYIDGFMFLKSHYEPQDLPKQCLIHVRHIHTLQNLCFALNNEELTLTHTELITDKK